MGSEGAAACKSRNYPPEASCIGAVPRAPPEAQTREAEADDERGVEGEARLHARLGPGELPRPVRVLRAHRGADLNIEDVLGVLPRSLLHNEIECSRMNAEWYLQLSMNADWYLQLIDADSMQGCHDQDRPCAARVLWAALGKVR